MTRFYQTEAAEKYDPLTKTLRLHALLVALFNCWTAGGLDSEELDTVKKTEEEEEELEEAALKKTASVSFSRGSVLTYSSGKKPKV